MVKLYLYAVIINLLHSLQLVDYYDQLEFSSPSSSFNLYPHQNNKPPEQQQSYRYNVKQSNQQLSRFIDNYWSNSNYYYYLDKFCCKKLDIIVNNNFDINSEQSVLIRLFKQLACAVVTDELKHSNFSTTNFPSRITIVGHLEKNQDLRDLRLIVDRFVDIDRRNSLLSTLDFNLLIKSLENILLKFGNSLRQLSYEESNEFNKMNKSIDQDQLQISKTESLAKYIAVFIVFILLSVFVFYIINQIFNCFLNWKNTKLCSILSLVNVLFLPLYYQFNLVFKHLNMIPNSDSDWFLYHFLFATSVALNLFVLVRYLLSFANFSYHHHSVSTDSISTVSNLQNDKQPKNGIQDSHIVYTQIKSKSSSQNTNDQPPFLNLNSDDMTDHFVSNKTQNKNNKIKFALEDDKMDNEMLDYEKITADIEEIFNSTTVESGQNLEKSCPIIDKCLQTYIDNNSRILTSASSLVDELDSGCTEQFDEEEEEDDDDDETAVETYEIDEIIDEDIEEEESQSKNVNYEVQSCGSTSTVGTCASSYYCSNLIHKNSGQVGLDNFVNLLINHHQLYPKAQEKSPVHILPSLLDISNHLVEDSEDNDVD